MHRWKLRKVHGEPVSRAFWAGGLGQFVVAHKLEPQDSVVSLAIKFGVEVRGLIWNAFNRNNGMPRYESFVGAVRFPA